jgi:hypothetical protein
MSTIHCHDVTIEENGRLEIDRDINLMNVNRLFMKKESTIKILAKIFKLDASLLDVSD